MGYQIHHAVLATTWNENAIKEIVKWIHTLPNDYQKLFITIPGFVNDYRTIIMAPEGSKAGWPESEQRIEIQEQFIQKVKEFDYEDGSNPFQCIICQYGECNPTIEAIRS